MLHICSGLSPSPNTVCSPRSVLLLGYSHHSGRGSNSPSDSSARDQFAFLIYTEDSMWMQCLQEGLHTEILLQNSAPSQMNVLPVSVHVRLDIRPGPHRGPLTISSSSLTTVSFDLRAGRISFRPRSRGGNWNPRDLVLVCVSVEQVTPLSLPYKHSFHPGKCVTCGEDDLS